MMMMMMLLLLMMMMIQAWCGSQQLQAHLLAGREVEAPASMSQNAAGMASRHNVPFVSTT